MKDLATGALETAGYTVVRGFLNEAELGILRRAFAASKAAKTGLLLPITPETIDSFRQKLEGVASVVRSTTGITSDFLHDGNVFDTSVGNFGWHQDNLNHWMFQQNYHELNFWIPVVKPEVTKSNLTVVPYDALVAREPRLKKLIGSGASNYPTVDGKTLVLDHCDGSAAVQLDFDIEELAVTPELAAGDLLLMRSDMVHRTQDADTERVAVSFRVRDSSAIVTKAKFVGGRSMHKLMSMMTTDFVWSSRALQGFLLSGKSEMTVKELVGYLHGTTPTPPMNPYQFLAAFMREMAAVQGSSTVKLTPCWCNRCASLSTTVGMFDDLFRKAYPAGAPATGDAPHIAFDGEGCCKNLMMKPRPPFRRA